MSSFMLIHRHRPAECRVAWAAWKGFDSPLRGRAVQTTCGRYRSGPDADGIALHESWWIVEAGDVASALAQVPPYVAERSEAREVSEVMVG